MTAARGKSLLAAPWLFEYRPAQMCKLSWRCFLLLLCLAGLGFGQAQEPPGLEVRAQGPDALFEYEENTATVTDPSGVLVTYGEAQMTARKVRFNRHTGEVEAEGDVRLQRGKEVWIGERLAYNFVTRELRADAFRSGLAPVYLTGQGLASSLTNQVHTATNAVVTTDNLAEPTYRVRARRLRVIPGKLIEARQATLFLGQTPVMYLPTYRRHLVRHSNFFVFVPGYRSLYGPYLLGTYHWFPSTNVEVGLHLDYRERRGIGGGPDVSYDAGLLGQGQLRTYGIRDEDPGNDLAGRPIGRDRHRISLLHSLPLGTNLTARITVHEQSDAQFVRDFYESEYRGDLQPKTFLEMNQLWPNFSLNLVAQPQVNPFFHTVERLPDVKLTAVRQRLGISPFYYEGENSASYLRLRTADHLGANYAAFRADSFHQLLLPQTFFGWLHVTPRAGGRFTHYGPTQGDGPTLSAQDRAVFNTGAELSTKASRLWPGAQSKSWDVNGLRHIVEPSLNYVYVPNPTRQPSQLPQFDSELESLRLTPIDFPDYAAVDSIDSQNVLRLGLRNRIQTKRRSGLDNLLHWALYTDWRLRPRGNQGAFADVFSDLDLKPRSWLTLSSETRFDLDNRVWRAANHMATFEPSSRWSWRVGHRYLRDDAGFGTGNNLILSSFTCRLNENWAVRVSHHFEARDGAMEEQYYTLYRDLRSWTTALTLRLRANRGGPADVSVAITFSLKAVPRFALGRERDAPSLLLGE
jgi:lipopolysaccharide assembly outer membrane protein LptD (OstA)